jgi:hypothetical protein
MSSSQASSVAVHPADKAVEQEKADEQGHASGDAARNENYAEHSGSLAWPLRTVRHLPVNAALLGDQGALVIEDQSSSDAAVRHQ